MARPLWEVIVTLDRTRATLDDMLAPGDAPLYMHARLERAVEALTEAIADVGYHHGKQLMEGR